MPRARKRVRLEDGLKLDMNKLMRDGLGQAGMNSRPISIRWTRTYTDEEIAGGCILLTAESEDRARLRIMMVNLDQRIELVAQPRRLGGQQWYSCVRLRAGNVQCCGCLPAQRASTAAKRGGRRLPMAHNSRHRWIEPSAEGRRSKQN